MRNCISEIPLESTRRALLVSPTIQMQLRNTQVIKPVAVTSSTFPTTIQQQSIQHYRLSVHRTQKKSFRSTNLFKSKNTPKTQQIKIPLFQVRHKYNISDLTETLISRRLRLQLVIGLVLVFFILRYESFVYCVFVSLHSEHYSWVFPWIAVRLLYFLVVLKTSLSMAQTSTQVALKTHWNSLMNDDFSDYFSVVSNYKLLRTIIRGLLPVQLSFLYLKTTFNSQRQYKIYTSINYIFISIQFIIFYPFFIAYCFYLKKDDHFSLNKYFQDITLFATVCGMVIFVVINIALIYQGIRIKYGTIAYWWTYKQAKQLKKKKNNLDLTKSTYLGFQFQ